MILKRIRIIIFYLALLICLSEAAVPYYPRFSIPNQYNWDGRTCAELRPSFTVDCPPYGIHINTHTDGGFTAMSQNEIESVCTNMGFEGCAQNEYLFPDGMCRACPNGYTVEGDGTGDLWCANGEQKITYENPFNCGGDTQIPRAVANTYRPCKWPKGMDVVTIPNYYKRDDFDQQLAMSHCYAQIFDRPTVIDDETFFQRTVIRTEFYTHDHGFLQCPRAYEEYNFFTLWWSLYYAIYIIGGAILVAYYFYKKADDKRAHKAKLEFEEQRLTRDSTLANDNPMDVSDLLTVKQFGLKRSWAGDIAWLSIWTMSWAFNILFLMLTLDIYGMFHNTLCPTEYRELCAGKTWDFREGYLCATGCLFSRRQTSAPDPYWPYIPNPRGMDQIFAIMTVLFFVSGVWWILLVVFYDKMYQSFYKKCLISEATTIVCLKPKEPDVRIESENSSKIVNFLEFFERLYDKYFDSKTISEACKVHIDDLGKKYILFQSVKYTYDGSTHEYRIKKITIAKTKKEICALQKSGLSSSEAYERLRLLGENRITYILPTWGVSLWNELFSLFYVYQIIYMWIWCFNYFWTIAIFVMCVIIFAATMSILVKRNAQKALKTTSDQSDFINVFRDGQLFKTTTHHLVPGDIIAIESGTHIYADCVLISGRVVMNESSLTGEPSPIPKLSLPNLDEVYGRSAEDMKYTLLAGTSVESVSNSNDTHTLAVVYNTGMNTKQGQLLWSMLFPPKIRFKFDDHFTIVFLALFVFGFFIMAFVGYLMYWVAISIFFGIHTMAHTLNPLVPSMFITAQARCSAQLKKLQIFTLEMPRTFVAAKTKTFCFDKTGTLTKQGMEFNGFSIVTNDKQTLMFENNTHKLTTMISMIMGCCHELDFSMKDDITHKQKYVGNEVDVEMFKNSNYEFSKQENEVTTLHNTEENSYLSIKKRFEFNRETMMMSAIVEDHNTHKNYLISKGSYEYIAKHSKPNTLPNELENYSSVYAMKGHYILAIGAKEIDSHIDIENITRKEIENELNFYGLLHFVNELKDDTKDAIEAIQNGNIRCVMITGDNIYTACNIARESGLSSTTNIVIGDLSKDTHTIIWTEFGKNHELSFTNVIKDAKRGYVDIAVTSQAFDFLRNQPSSYFKEKDSKHTHYKDAMRSILAYTRIFARMKPDHKVEAVRMHMEQNITGMCGDGANDASALRLAHCGIAIATGSTHATIVAPFNSSRHSLFVVCDVIRYGRGTLSTAFASYKRLIMAGLSVVIMKMFLYHFSLQISDIAWLTIDALINVPAVIFMLYSKPAQRLTRYRPTSSLFGPEVLTSICFQLLIVFLTFLVSFIILYNQNFFACKNFDTSNANLAIWWTMGDNYESSMSTIIIMGIYMVQAFIYNIGFDYRRSWYKNYPLLVLFTFYTAVVLGILFSPPNFLTCLYRVNCGDHTLLERWDELGLIEYNGGVPFVPEGCPCNQQIAYSETCEEPYIDCQNSNYNSMFHHTIFEDYFRWSIFYILIGNFIMSMFCEWFIVYGPVRRYLRKNKKNKKLVKFE